MVFQIDTNIRSWQKKGKALITGASAGLGADYAISLAKIGFIPVLIARRRAKLEEIAKRIQEVTGIQSEILEIDLADSGDIISLIKYIESATNIDIVVNNAGFGTLGVYYNVSIEKSLEMLSVHVISMMKICRSIVPKMILQNRGVIINIASLKAFLYTGGTTMYSATKAFIVTFTQNLALELQNAPILLQVLCPGYIHTEFHQVRDFIHFDKNSIPESMWMTTDKVVMESLYKLNKKKVVLIPGKKNRILKWIFLNTFVGKKMQKRWFIEVEKSELIKQQKRSLDNISQNPRNPLIQNNNFVSQNTQSNVFSMNENSKIKPIVAGIGNRSFYESNDIDHKESTNFDEKNKKSLEKIKANTNSRIK